MWAHREKRGEFRHAGFRWSWIRLSPSVPTIVHVSRTRTRKTHQMLSSVGSDGISQIPSLLALFTRGPPPREAPPPPRAVPSAGPLCAGASRSSGCRPVATSQQMSKIVKARLNTSAFLRLKPSMTFFGCRKGQRAAAVKC